MAIRMEKSGELMLIYGADDDSNDQNEWDPRRQKLGVLVVSVAVVTAAVFVGPHVPGFEIIRNAFKAVLAAIWQADRGGLEIRRLNAGAPEA